MSQFERIPGPRSQAAIVKLRSKDGIETVKWLCPVAVERAKAEKWTILETREPGHHLGCQEHQRCAP